MDMMVYSVDRKWSGDSTIETSYMQTIPEGGEKKQYTGLFISPWSILKIRDK
jgi:hypothetical protein